MLFVIGLALAACAADPVETHESGEQSPDESRIVGYAPNGLPVVDGETMAFDESAVSERSQAITTEPFFGVDEYGWGVAPWRQNNCLFRASASQSTNFGTQYGDPGEGTTRFQIQNRHVARALWQNSSSGALNWWIHFPAGSPCNEGRCTIYVCIEAGTQWPRCVSTHDPRGATQEFDGDPWPANGWKTFLLAYWADYGPGFPTYTYVPYTAASGSAGGEDLYIAHTCL
jgi:hypothetical protein